MSLIKMMNSNWAIKREAYTSIMDILIAHKEGPKIDLKALEAKALSITPPQTGSEPYQVIDNIAVIPVKGVLSKSPSLFERVVYGASSMTDIKTKISHALNNSRIKGIILDIDSPGGTVDGTQELADFIYSAREQKNIYAFCDGMMASAACWIGTSASQVYISSKTVEVGSIGVITTHYDYSEMDKRWGVNVTEIYAGKYKASGSDAKPLSPEDKEYIQSRIDYLYSVFVESVAKNRNESVDTVLTQMADAKIFIGDEAVTVGLVDGVSTFEAVIDKMRSNSAAGAAVHIQKNGNSSLESQMSASGAGAENNQIINQEKNMITIEALQKEFKENPDLYEAVKKDILAGVARDENVIKEEAAVAERERIKGVADQLIPGHEKIITEMMFDGKTTAGEAAIKINAEHKKALAVGKKDFEADLGKGLAYAESGNSQSADGESNKPLEEKAKTAWDSDPKLRAEFSENFATYVSYLKAQEKGKVRINSKEGSK